MVLVYLWNGVMRQLDARIEMPAFVDIPEVGSAYLRIAVTVPSPDVGRYVETKIRKCVCE